VIERPHADRCFRSWGQRPIASVRSTLRADSASTRVASGRTGDRAKAALPLRAGSTLHRRERALRDVPIRMSRWMAANR
jgi:hypothetical protein